jgi:hypothetical protein
MEIRLSLALRLHLFIVLFLLPALHLVSVVSFLSESQVFGNGSLCVSPFFIFSLSLSLSFSLFFTLREGGIKKKQENNSNKWKGGDCGARDEEKEKEREERKETETKEKTQSEREKNERDRDSKHKWKARY